MNRYKFTISFIKEDENLERANSHTEWLATVFDTYGEKPTEWSVDEADAKEVNTEMIDDTEDIADVKLKPCPLCGSKAVLKNNRWVWYVKCTGCGIEAVRNTGKGACDMWNKRFNKEDNK